jgi:hypothetical protein
MQRVKARLPGYGGQGQMVSNLQACNSMHPCSRAHTRHEATCMHARRDAWNKLGDLPCDGAKRQYVRLVSEIDPAWQEAAGSSSAGKPGGERKAGMGPVFSSFAHAGDGEEVSCSHSACSLNP